MLVLFFFVFLATGKVTFSEIDSTTRLHLGQGGLLCVYLSGLLAGLGFFWNGRARANIQYVERESMSMQSQLTLLRNQHAEKFRNHEGRIGSLESQLTELTLVRSAAIAFPLILERLGAMAMALLVIGTMLQFISLG